MQIVIDIPEVFYEALKETDKIVSGQRSGKSLTSVIFDAVANGTPLPKYTEELKRRLFMEIDGGTDDKYLRYADVCDRIRNTIDTYINAESEE